MLLPTLIHPTEMEIRLAFDALALCDESPPCESVTPELQYADTLDRLGLGVQWPETPTDHFARTFRVRPRPYLSTMLTPPQHISTLGRCLEKI